MSTVNGFQVGSETLKYNYESLDNYNTPNFSISSSTTYAVGDYVMYNGKLYKCTTATTGGTWVNSSWTQAVLSDDVSDLTRQLSDLESAITEQTRNLIIGKITHASVESNGRIISSSSVNGDCYYAPVENGKTYCVTTNENAGLVCGFFNEVPAPGSISYNSSRIVQASKVIVAPITGYICFRTGYGYQRAQIEEGNTPTTYIRPTTAIDAEARENINEFNDYVANTLPGAIKSIASEITQEIIFDSEIDAFDYKISGKYIQPDGKTISTNQNYAITPLVMTKPGDCWVYEGDQTAAGVPTIIAYSDFEGENPIPVVYGQTVSGRKIVFAPDNAKTIRAQGAISSDLHFYHEHNCIFYDTNQSVSLRSFIAAHITDNHKGNEYTVKIYDGTYDIGADFTQEELANNTFIGFIVPDYVTLEGINGPTKVTLSCDVSSSSISTVNLGNCSGLKGLHITGENCRYAIHDDFGNNGDGSIRIIENCIIESTNCSYAYAYGGGCRSGQKFYYKNTKFIGNTYEDCGFLMHSNTNFTEPACLEFFNCRFESLNGHPERSFTLRALSNVDIKNKCFINNSYSLGYYLLVSENNIIDWTIEGGGNNQDAYVEGVVGFTLDFYDKPSTTAVNNMGRANVGVFRFKDGIPQWWNGSAWVDATGTVIT